MMTRVNLPHLPAGTPEVVAIHHDLWLLSVCLQFGDGAVYVRFETVRGFRVLKECDLYPMLEVIESRDHWLWRVEAGGWRATERARADFPSSSDDEREYLVLGADYCVSVITETAPEYKFISVDA